MFNQYITEYAENVSSMWLRSRILVKHKTVLTLMGFEKGIWQ